MSARLRNGKARATHVPPAWIDGEIVVLADNGVPSFQALQNAFDGKRTSNIIYYAFDLPFIAGRDIRGEPLRLRRELLAQLVAAGHDDHIRFSEAFSASPADLVASACRMGLEGIMAKRQSAGYVSSRTDDWVKIKCGQRQEFVIVGYTVPKGGRVGFGALLLGVYEAAGGLRYAGSVGTGFDDRGLLDLHKQLTALKQKATPAALETPNRCGTCSGSRQSLCARCRSQNGPRGACPACDLSRPSNGQASTCDYQGTGIAGQLDRTEDQAAGTVNAGGAATIHANKVGQAIQSGPRHRPVDRPDEAGPRTLLRAGGVPSRDALESQACLLRACAGRHSGAVILSKAP